MSVAPRIDSEFQALLPALTPDQRAGLQASLLAEGVLAPLVVWEEEGVLLDGHNRLEIAQREGLPFGTRTVKLVSREAAVEWIFRHQRDRRNLTPDQLALVMGRHYNRTKKKDHTYLIGNQHAKQGLQKVEHVAETTADRLAKDYGVSDLTIQRAGKFAAAVETLKTVDPDIESKVVTGKGPTRKAVIAAADAIAEPETAKALLSPGKPVSSPQGAPKAKSTNAPPSDGMRIARSAAGKLNEIRNDDLERSEAFAFMRSWLNAHEA